MISRVYFIEAGDGGPIKIGLSLDVAARLVTLQASNPLPLRLLATMPGDHGIERELHRRFKGERLNGEWFRGDGEVRRFALSIVTGEAVEQPARKPPPVARPRKAHWRPRHYTRAEWNAMFFVGDGGSIFRSAEAEQVLAHFEKGARR